MQRLRRRVCKEFAYILYKKKGICIHNKFYLKEKVILLFFSDVEKVMLLIIQVQPFLNGGPKT